MSPVLMSTASDGTVCVLIQPVEYMYHIDAALIHEVKRLFRHTPWKAVNILKERAYHFSKQIID